MVDWMSLKVDDSIIELIKDKEITLRDQCVLFNNEEDAWGDEYWFIKHDKKYWVAKCCLASLGWHHAWVFSLEEFDLAKQVYDILIAEDLEVRMNIEEK